MQLLRTSALSLVRGQPSASDRLDTLLPWIARGDEVAYGLFFEGTKGFMFGVLFHILGHPQTAEEVLVEVYEEVRQRAVKFGQQNENPVTWLLLIAHRRAVERFCRQRTTNSETLRKRDANPSSTYSINITEQRRSVRAELKAISPLQHRMIELAFFSGLTSVEIARELGQSPAAVEGEIRYAMLRLFGLFKSMGFSIDPGTQT